MNNVTMTGRLTADPDQASTTHSGKQVLDLRIAVNHPKRDTVFVDVKCWGKTAENAPQCLEKGSLIGVTGELARDDWTDKTTGEKRHKYYINAREVDFIEYRLDQAATVNGAEPTTAEVA